MTQCGSCGSELESDGSCSRCLMRLGFAEDPEDVEEDDAQDRGSGLPPELRLSAGDRLGGYEVVGVLGRGGMGEVYRARDPRLGREVAIKVLPRRLSESRDAQARFEREARTASALNHPHICVLHDVGHDNGTAFLVMELVDGESLAERLDRGPLAPSLVLRLGAQIADALSSAHRAGVIHRDLKPANVMMAPSGAKLMDFGLARTARPGGGVGPSSLTQSPTMPQPLTVEGSILGTIPYMAPEQLEGDDADPKSDLWALGCVLYEATAGRPAFEGTTPAALISSIMKDEPPLLSELVPTTPRVLECVVRECLRKDPDSRWQSAHDIALALRWRAGDRGATTDRPSEEPVQRHFALTASHVRKLEERNPRLVGYPVEYIDNRVESKRLVVFLHGIAADAGRVEDAVRASPYRAVAITLIGFGAGKRQRPSLSMDDHSRVLRWVLGQVVADCRPERTLLVGISAGADQLLRMVHDDAAAGVEVEGLLAMGANVSGETCFSSRAFGEIDVRDTTGTLASLKALSTDIQSLDTWVAVQSYLTQQLLNTDIAVLKRYARDLVAPFDQPGDPLADWYRAARRRIPRVRLVFSNQEAEAAEKLLARHLESNVLGDDFTEDSFVIEPAHHLSLFDTELISRHVRAMME